MLRGKQHTMTTARRRGLALVTGGALALGMLSAAPSAQAAPQWSWTASLVQDIAAKKRSSDPADFTTFRGKVYFAADSAKHGRELWRTDGTRAGTKLVKDIVKGKRGSRPLHLSVVGRTLYFATTNANGDPTQLWRSDGTAKGTRRVANVRVTSPVTAVGSTGYFVANDGKGKELWKTRGTARTTVRVKDIRPGSRGSDPDQLTALGNKLYFSATDAQGATRLWRSTGTAAGTVPIDRARPAGAYAPGPQFLTAAQGRLWFSGFDDAHGWELWTSNGTVAGTSILKDIVPGEDWSYPGNWSGFTVFRGAVHFRADDGLWRSDGTAAGTVNILPRLAGAGPAELTVAGNRLYFFASHPTLGYELWASDGTTAGTRVVKDILPPQAPPGEDDSDPDNWLAGLRTVGNRVVFMASDGRHGRELWASDGTAPGTRLIRDINPNQNDVFSNPEDYRAIRNELGVIGNRVVFAADNGKLGRELWRAAWAPINAFTLPRAGTPNPAKGTTKVALRLPNAGQVRVVPARSRTVRAQTKKVGANGRVNVYLVPTKALRTALVKKAKARKKSVVATRVRVKVTYTPTRGFARTKVQTYTIKLRVNR